MISLWYAEAGRNGAFPLDDRSALEILTTPRPLLSPARNRYVYYPDLAEVPESQAVNIRNRSYGIGALVDIPAPGAEGVLFAHGSRFGGHALYIKNNRLHYVYNWVGHFEQKIVGTEDVPVGKNLILAANFVKDGEDPPGVSTGILSLYHGETKVGEQQIKTQPGKFSIAGEGLCVGRDGWRARHRRLPGPPPARVHRRHHQPRRGRRQRRAVRRPRTRSRRHARPRITRELRRLSGGPLPEHRPMRSCDHESDRKVRGRSPVVETGAALLSARRKPETLNLKRSPARSHTGVFPETVAHER